MSRRPKRPKSSPEDPAIRDYVAAELGIAAEVEGVLPAEGETTVFPLIRDLLRPVYFRVLARKKAAPPGRDRKLLDVVAGALRSSILDLDEGGGGDPVGLRLLLWTSLRRYEKAVGRKTFLALLDAWNAAQAGRDEFVVRTREELRELVYDRSPEGELVRPTEIGLNLPAARIRRIVGHRL